MDAPVPPGIGGTVKELIVDRFALVDVGGIRGDQPHNVVDTNRDVLIVDRDNGVPGPVRMSDLDRDGRRRRLNGGIHHDGIGIRSIEIVIAPEPGVRDLRIMVCDYAGDIVCKRAYDILAVIIVILAGKAKEREQQGLETSFKLVELFRRKIVAEGIEAPGDILLFVGVRKGVPDPSDILVQIIDVILVDIAVDADQLEFGQTIHQCAEHVDQLVHFIVGLAEEKPGCRSRRLLEGPVTGDLVA